MEEGIKPKNFYTTVYRDNGIKVETYPLELCKLCADWGGS
jgi:hypothetical protein